MNNDLISRDTLKEAIRKRLGISSLEYLTEQEKVIVEEIDNAPTADITKFYYNGFTDGKELSKRLQGEWLSHYDYCEKHGYNPSVSIAFWWCDQCGQAVELPTNFCPDCGAKIRGA